MRIYPEFCCIFVIIALGIYFQFIINQADESDNTQYVNDCWVLFLHVNQTNQTNQTNLTTYCAIYGDSYSLMLRTNLNDSRVIYVIQYINGTFVSYNIGDGDNTFTATCSTLLWCLFCPAPIIIFIVTIFQKKKEYNRKKKLEAIINKYRLDIDVRLVRDSRIITLCVLGLYIRLGTHIFPRITSGRYRIYDDYMTIWHKNSFYIYIYAKSKLILRYNLIEIPKIVYKSNYYLIIASKMVDFMELNKIIVDKINIQTGFITKTVETSTRSTLEKKHDYCPHIDMPFVCIYSFIFDVIRMKFIKR